MALFGSRARGTGAVGSDFDLAVMPSSALLAPRAVQVAEALIHALERSDVDLVWLPEASWVVHSEVARDGRPLYESVPGDFLEFQAVAHWREVDARRRRRTEKDLVDRYLSGEWSMNEPLVRRHLESMIRHLQELERVLDEPLDQFVAEPRSYHTAERLTELLVESAARINTEIAATVAKVPASDDYTSFFSLASCGWLDPETARLPAPLAGLRNVLVHQYEEVRLPDLYETLTRTLPDWRTYVRSVAERL